VATSEVVVTGKTLVSGTINCELKVWNHACVHTSRKRLGRVWEETGKKSSLCLVKEAKIRGEALGLNSLRAKCSNKFSNAGNHKPASLEYVIYRRENLLPRNWLKSTGKSRSLKIHRNCHQATFSTALRKALGLRSMKFVWKFDFDRRSIRPKVFHRSAVAFRLMCVLRTPLRWKIRTKP